MSNCPPQVAPTAVVRVPLTAAAILLLVALGACTSTPDNVGPYSPPTELQRNTHQAKLLSREAAARIDAGDLEEAESLLRQSLTADLFYGPAHNNLGVVFLMQDKLYEAAQEFEWAKKLLPSAPDPRVNLALVLEQAGREEDALLAWEGALEVAPGCLQAREGLARLEAARGVAAQDELGAAGTGPTRRISWPGWPQGDTP